MSKPPPYRHEDERLVSGTGRFLENQPFADGLHGVFVRAPFAHARLTTVDTADALASPGVHAVITGADLVNDGVGPLRCSRPMDSFDGTPFLEPPRHALAVETVRFVGEAIAFVVAETVDQARDAAELVMFDFEGLPVEVDPQASREVAFVYKLGDQQASDAAFASAAHVVTISQATNRVVAMPIEPRSVIGTYDPGSERFTLQTQSQGVHFIRRAVAASLAVSEDRVRVVTGDVGGSFGMKLTSYPEQVVVLAAARRAGHPIRWVSSRTEGLLADTHAREHRTTAELALDSDGRFLALRVLSHGSLGAYATAFGTSTVSAGFARTIGNTYRIPALDLTVRAVYTNTSPTDAYRGAGKPESVHLMERLVDKAAGECAIDRIELRRRNLVTRAEMPYHAANGAVWDDGDFEGLLDDALATADWSGFAERRSLSEARGRLRGFGLGLYLHLTGSGTAETAVATLGDGGKVIVRTGSQSNGQGHETTFAQLVAERLGIEVTRVEVRQGDSADLPRNGAATAGSSSLQVAGTTIVRATDALLDRLRPRAAEELEAATDDLVYDAGAFAIAGTDRTIDLAALAAQMDARERSDCAGSVDFSGEPLSVPNGAYACEVEVDPETGLVAVQRFSGVDDVGRRINPVVVMGQLHGAIAQGIGQALLEQIVYDDHGQLLTGSLMDYTVPRADDLTNFSMQARDLPTRLNFLGAKGAGEVGCIGAPGAVMNAIADAIGTQDIEMPATPERVWRALKRAEAQST